MINKCISNKITLSLVSKKVFVLRKDSELLVNKLLVGNLNFLLIPRVIENDYLELWLRFEPLFKPIDHLRL